MELITDPNATFEVLQRQNDEMKNLIKQFSEKIAMLSENDREANKEVIEQLTHRVVTLRATLENAMERVLLLEKNVENGKEITENTNWYEISNDHETNFTDDRMDVEGENAQVSRQETVETDQTVESLVKPAVEQVSSMANVNASERDQLKTSENSQCDQNVQNEKNRDDALTNALQNSGEFTYQSLIMYNAAFNELMKIEQVPDNAMPFHFRQLRDFITRYIHLCNEIRIGFAYVEPMLIANVISAFNSETFSNWKSQMIGKKASVKSIRAFLADQEEMTSDRWYKDSRFVMAQAIKKAQMVVNENPPSERTQSNQQPISEKVDESKIQPGTLSFATMLKTGNKPGCSHWGAPPASTGNPRPRANPTPVRSRSSSASEPGTRPTTNVSKDTQKTNEKKEKKQKGFVCLDCKGSHALYFCPRYLTKTLMQRAQYVKENNICPLCCLGRHSIMECSHGCCKNCEEPHNSTLCEISYNNKQKEKLAKKRGDQEDW